MYVVEKALAENIVNRVATPTFVTNKSILNQKVKLMKETFGNNVKILYAVKANYNPSVVKSLKKSGIDGIDAVSPFEVKLAKEIGFNSEDIVFTGNNLSTEELKYLHDENVIINIGSISELKRYGEIYQGAEISIRINPEIGDGEFKGVITGGKSSKFGIALEEIDNAKRLISEYKLKIIGIQCHIGSGMYDETKFKEAAILMFKLATQFKELKFIDLGGGFGVRYRPSDKEINLKKFAAVINSHLKEFNNEHQREIKILLEPGKFLVAESTCLLAKVTSINTYHGTIFVGIDTGMNHIIRPACYSAYHHIVNISSPESKNTAVKVVGNICESSDVFAEKIEIPMPKEGDILGILTAGAYCASMGSLYNLRPYAAEVLVDQSNFHVTRHRLTVEQSIKGLGFADY